MRNAAAVAMIVLAGCSSRPAASRSATPVSQPKQPTSVATSSPGAPRGVEPAASSKPSDSGAAEQVIRAYQDLAQRGASRVELERFLADHPALLEAEAEPYGRALNWVLEFEHEQAAIVLIRAGASIAPSEPGEGSPLHVAARGGLDGVVTELLARGAPPGTASYWGTPLHFAAKEGHASTMRLLLRAGADPNVHAEDHDFTPLHAAVIGRHADAVRVLIAAKADLEAKDDDGRTALHWGGFAYSPQPVHIYPKLGQPHLTRFVDPGPAEAMKLLLDAGARIDALDGAGNTPLHEAVRVGSRRGVELLLARGARRDAKNQAGETPRSLARARNDPEILRLLAPAPSPPHR